MTSASGTPASPVPPLILASRSPRRAALLRQMGFDFSVVWKAVDENLKEQTDPAGTVLSLSARKAEAVLPGIVEGLVVGADTLVVLEGEILGKPESQIEAGRMLRRLSGRTHEVFTGFTLIDAGADARSSGVERTAVTFRRLDDWEIDEYVSTGMPMDKAGAYGIQDRSGLFVDRIDGCFYNVVGFPLTKFFEGLKKLVGPTAVRKMLSHPGRAPSERNGYMIPFTKMTGTGNDFIVFDNREGRWTGKETDFFASICRRRFSAGADGIILVQKGDHAPVRMRYFNSDGGEAAMCANGARCTAFYARNKGFTRENFFLLEAADGLHEVEVTGGKVKLEMKKPRDFRSGFGFVHQFGIREGGFLNTGVPHLVLFMDGAFELKNLDVDATAPYYRNHRFFEGGTNVNFVQRISFDTIQVRTFERGVEAETFSCGTGCVASALIASRAFGAPSPISVRTQGGELSVEFHRNWNNVHLTGQVRMVYEGSLYPEGEQPR